MPPGIGVELLEEMRGDVIRDLREFKVLSTGEVQAVVNADEEDVPAAAPLELFSFARAPFVDDDSAAFETVGRDPAVMLEPFVLGGRDALGRLDVRFLRVGILGTFSTLLKLDTLCR